ncbi:hypothetical protein BpJC7_13090 [Weizmannia acidilactici]|uniref:SigE-dependent sporulation protein n=1 Tax=Weizmannia acidilactici TaxID=2607726 RepID=A0A5J4J4V0_9BACI|nr:sporulation YhaL family protein [Weizmannia acidilactici]GER65810.1 hypothetical protein BpJC4_02810 [Weizmannia acidilactici]GER70006.1 hypothetical protein BpJC7_13090 [Weizmannia acidilactici]GER73061.1 hypothetical protein BpPP18_11280 [Weizmannia acidilactici]
MDFPIWIYFVVAGIVICAFMAVKSARDEREQEQAWIEKEGEVFIERMKKEKEMRHGDPEKAHEA